MCESRDAGMGCGGCGGSMRLVMDGDALALFTLCGCGETGGMEFCALAF